MMTIIWLVIIGHVHHRDHVHEMNEAAISPPKRLLQTELKRLQHQHQLNKTHKIQLIDPLTPISSQ